jgi:dipeptidyl aminopeptidase/acylaminoacyl peptidase
MRLRVTSAVWVVGMAAALAQSRPPTLVESLDRPFLGATAIAPDGQRIAYLKRETDWKNNEYVWQLWLFDRTTGRDHQLTRGRKSIAGPEWSPDGRLIAFVTEREPNALQPPPGDQAEDKGDSKQDKAGGDDKRPAKRQIWMLSLDGGEAWQATKAETDVEEFHWSQDGHWIVFMAVMPDSKADRTRKERYSDYRVVSKDYTQHQLWRIDAAAARSGEEPVADEALTHDASLDIKDFAIAPDSGHIAFSAGHDPLLSHLGDQDLYLIETGGNVAAKKIVALPGPDSHPLFSPDGTQLAFETALGQPYFFYANSHIAVVDLAKVESKTATTAKDVRDLTGGFDESPSLIDWRPHGIYFDALSDGAGVFRVDPEGGHIERLGPHDLLIRNVSVTADGATLAWTGDDATHLEDLYVSASAGSTPQKLTDQTTHARDFTLGSVETVTWKSKDGTRIEGVLYKPRDFDPKKKYPLLVKIHGGPTGVSLPQLWPLDYAYPVQAFLDMGALVLEPNYRGSGGFGAKFRALNVRNLGVGDMWDVMSGIDALIAKGIVDPNRLGAMGWSQGGYISAFLTTHTDRFKAISVGAGISDWSTYYVSTDVTEFTPQYLKATPWDDPAVYAKTSPITTIKSAKTPTLIQHGSNDQRVPLPDAFELYRGLQDQHVDSRLVIYQGFGHGIDKPKSALALLQANLDWFSHYLWNQPFPKDSPLYGRSEAAEAAQ